MSRFHPDQIEKARRSVVTHNAAIPQQARRVSRVIQWMILTDDRPSQAPTDCTVIAFRRPRAPWWPPLPALYPTGGDAA